MFSERDVTPASYPSSASSPSSETGRSRGWEPVLPDASGEAARTSIRTIADVLAPFAGGDISTDSRDPLSPATTAARRVTLAHGAPGMALFFAYLDRAQPDQGHDETARRFLDLATDGLSTVPLPPTLYGGLTGVTWTLAHLGDRLYGRAEEDPLDELDELVLTYLRRDPWGGHFDLISGLVGHAVYAFERLPRPAAVACLDTIVDRLAEMSEKHPDGITWKTPARLLPANQRATAPNGHYNLGVAHGVPGIIAVLAGICHHDIAIDRARPLLEGALAWLWAQPQPPEGRSRFGYFFAEELPVKPCRMAWCYGDPGIAAAGVAASELTGAPTWTARWTTLGREATMHPHEKAGVVDAPLCHGSAGLGHVYNRLYQATGDAAFADASREWFLDALARQREGEGIAGYASFEQEQWIADPGFLTGTAGIGLALIAATSPIEPAWDRLLLLSLPHRMPRERETGGKD